MNHFDRQLCLATLLSTGFFNHEIQELQKRSKLISHFASNCSKLLNLPRIRSSESSPSITTLWTAHCAWHSAQAAMLCSIWIYRFVTFIRENSVVSFPGDRKFLFGDHQIYNKSSAHLFDFRISVEIKRNIPEKWSWPTWASAVYMRNFDFEVF